MNPIIHFKKIRIVPILIAATVMIGVALTSQGLGQPGPPAPTVFNGIVFSGIIDDFTPVLDSNGPWQVSGQWSLTLGGHSGRADFSWPVNMVRAENEVRMQHTHQVTINDGQVTRLANGGFQISGNAIITVNGNLAAFSGSPVVVQVTGGSVFPSENIAVTFGGGAVMHFGDQPFHGVVTQR
ncbi:MAG: hypothetical protein ACRD5Z_18485 [Bryobacteraceae bacterium]